MAVNHKDKTVKISGCLSVSREARFDIETTSSPGLIGRNDLLLYP